ncbi:MAG TPA: hypothetical protein VK054_12030, partial [Beutenbergiaceae bacterium]|nr:hypothetical protein [Beutenbergiaceae bacterium]
SHISAQPNATAQHKEKNTVINFNASNHGAGGGGPSTADALESTTYQATLIAAQMYKNNKYQSEELTNQITLIWDTGLVMETDEGEEVPVYIYDTFINFSFNEKAKLTSRLKALGFEISPTTNVQLKINGASNLDELEHTKLGRDARKAVEAWEINGENVFGREALVTVEVVERNDRKYANVTNASPPMRSPAGGKVKARPATNEAPAGAPV